MMVEEGGGEEEEAKENATSIADVEVVAGLWQV